jgi:hypothetical protein
MKNLMHQFAAAAVMIAAVSFASLAPSGPSYADTAAADCTAAQPCPPPPDCTAANSCPPPPDCTAAHPCVTTTSQTPTQAEHHKRHHHRR